VCAWALIFFRCRNNFYPTLQPLTELTESLTLSRTCCFSTSPGAMGICGKIVSEVTNVIPYML
jgi:hypothetical protein